MAAPTTQVEKVVIISEAILSYPKLFVPEAGPNGGEPKYGCTLIPIDETSLPKLKRAALAVAYEKLGEDKAKKLIKAGKLKMPFIKTTEDDAGYPEGSTYIRPRSKTKPGIVSRFPDPENPKKPAKITDPAEMYPGAIVAAQVVAFYYNTSGNQGISFAINGLQKLRDGERLAGAAPAEDVFSVDESVVAGFGDDVEKDADANTDETEEDISDLVG